jgi:DMSO/TMAO reductase YedYZ molybdopterin-dependent catalytic subunit
MDHLDHRLIVLSDDPVNAETPLALHRGTITPNHLFFCRNRFSWPEVEPSAWRLTVSGVVERPVSLTYDDLLSMPSRTLPVTLECAGNGRSAMRPPAEGEPWQFGAVSTAEWTGVPLSLVLDAVRVRDSARELVFEGLDRGAVDAERNDVPFARSLPLERALHPDTLLAYAMNGDVLPTAHGFPLRLLVPGWYGMASVKWLTHIHTVSEPFGGFFQRERYIMRDAPVPDGTPITQVGIRSVITTPHEGVSIAPGRHIVRGLAWSGAAPVADIEVSVDGSAWQPGTWTSPSHRYAWRSWECSWEAEAAGKHELRSRARDEAGNVQPDEGLWNSLGYANNAIQTVTVTVG